jgi:DNA-binding transcriptional MerR regulator
MEYSINRLAKMSGVSTRTLRYYDEIGLLKPAKTAPSGYRVYEAEQVDALQQILLFRELGFPLAQIKTLLTSAGFERELAFIDHLDALEQKRARLDSLIDNVSKSLAALKGEIIMTDEEKFAGFKQALIGQNEDKYGAEIRAKYGDKAVDEANAQLNSLSPEQYAAGERLRASYEQTLQAAFAAGEAGGALAQQACDLHRQWLGVFYPAYNKEYHKGLGEMYVSDERFRANYDKLAPGCAEFLRDAINIYCKVSGP